MFPRSGYNTEHTAAQRLYNKFIILILKTTDPPASPLPWWGFSGIMKQIIQMKHNMVKNPN